MKKIVLTLIVVFVCFMFSNAQVPWTGRTYCKITLDTKLMENPSCSLGGGGTLASECDKVYAHLGLCTCDIESDVRDCTSESNNEMFCLSQITPFQSLVWQHVVGNWGEVAEDDGVGLMVTEGNGVYSIEFIMEDYFSSDDVSTELGETSSIPSMIWDVTLGGKPYTMGMVFRNADGSLSGKDKLCKDIFIVDLLGDPQVIQGSDPTGPLFPAITLDIHDASIEEIMTLSDNTFIYPNPAGERFEIRYKIVKPDTEVRIRIFDAVGRMITDDFLGQQFTGWNTRTYSTEYMEKGIYMIQISLDNYIAHTERVIITH